jgi:hypothetical protein
VDSVFTNGWFVGRRLELDSCAFFHLWMGRLTDETLGKKAGSDNCKQSQCTSFYSIPVPIMGFKAAEVEAMVSIEP